MLLSNFRLGIKFIAVLHMTRLDFDIVAHVTSQCYQSNVTSKASGLIVNITGKLFDVITY